MPVDAREPASLPPDWREMTVAELRAWLRDHGYSMPYVIYAKRAVLIAWIEKNVSVPRCPTCGRPT